jgi:membrane protease YdiL (CAAX protease family)
MLINKTLGVEIKGMDYTISNMGDVMAAILVCAVLPVFLFIYYDNIYPGYIMHALNNLLAYLFIPLFLGG